MELKKTKAGEVGKFFTQYTDFEREGKQTKLACRT